MFRDEGTSLHNLIYSAADADDLGEEAGQGVMLQASQWWRDLRRSGQVSSFFKLLPPLRRTGLDGVILVECIEGSPTSAPLPESLPKLLEL